MSEGRILFGRVIVIALTTIFFNSFLNVAWGQVPGNRGGIGGELRGITQITGEVVCVDCSLQEAQQIRANAGDLYLLQHQTGQVVFRIDAFQDAAEHARWESIAGLSHRLSVRGPEGIFYRLTAEENLFKTVVITGLLRSDRTFDLNNVQVSG